MFAFVFCLFPLKINAFEKTVELESIPVSIVVNGESRIAYKTLSGPHYVGNTGVTVVGYITTDGNTGKILSYGLQNITGSPQQLSYSVTLDYNHYTATFTVNCYSTDYQVFGQTVFSISTPGPM